MIFFNASKFVPRAFLDLPVCCHLLFSAFLSFYINEGRWRLWRVPFLNLYLMKYRLCVILVCVILFPKCTIKLSFEAYGAILSIDLSIGLWLLRRNIKYADTKTYVG